MLTRYVLVLSFLFPILTAPAFAGEKELDWQIRQNEILEAQPGNAVTLASLLTYRGRETLKAKLLPRVPDHWRILTGGNLALRPNVNELHLSSFTLPARTAPGTYWIPLELHDLTGQVLAKRTQKIFVPPTDQVDLRLDSRRDVIIDGEVFELSLVVTNSSNRRHRVRLKLELNQSWPAELDYQILNLDAEESHPLYLRVETPGNIHQIEQLRMLLTAELEGVEAKPARSLLELQVMPLSNVLSKRRYLYGSLSAYGVAHREEEPFREPLSEASLQSRIELGGYLDEEEKHRLAFLYQGPDIESERSFELREELYLALTGPQFEITIGDFTAVPSPLTFGQRGRGAKVQLKRERYELGLLYQDGRIYLPREERSAAFGLLRLNRNWSLDALLLHRRPQAENSNILVSLSAEGRIHQAARLRLALARSGRTLTSSAGQAALVELWGNLPWMRYSLRHIQADGDFSGLYSGSTLSTASVSAPLPGALDLRLSLAESALPLDDSLEYVQIPIQSHRVIGLGWRLPGRSSTVSVERREQGQEEINNIEAIDFYEETWRLRWNQRLPYGRIEMSYDLGESEDRRSRSFSDLQRFGISSNLQVGERVDIDLRADYRRESGFNQPESAFGGHLRGRWQINDSFDLDLQWRRREREFGSANTLDGYRIRLGKIFPNNHRLSFISEFQESRGRRVFSDQTLVIDYAVPVALPVPQRSQTGALEGRVVDGATGLGAEGLYLQIGDVIVRTDAAGIFKVPILAPGSYPLTLHTAVLGPGRIPAADNPKQTEIFEGETQRLELFVTRAASLAGNLEQMKPAEGLLPKSDSEDREMDQKLVILLCQSTLNT